MILLDTDICIAILKGNERVLSHRARYSGTVGISFMTAAELFYGAHKSARASENLVTVEQFLISIDVLHSEQRILEKFGALKATLEKAGTRLADADLFIAATALTKCDALVTGNTRHFSRIEGLRVENWLA